MPIQTGNRTARQPLCTLYVAWLSLSGLLSDSLMVQTGPDYYHCTSTTSPLLFHSISIPLFSLTSPTTTTSSSSSTSHPNINPKMQKYTVPRARPLSPRELTQVNHYRALRERFHDGPYYAVLDAASSAAKKGSAARASFDPFHGMPSYSGRYQKKKRALPRMSGRAYGMASFFLGWAELG